MSFSIQHRRAGSGPPLPASPALPVWSTCLREVVFHESAPESATGTGNDTLAGAEAYAFLLETICGMHSPMVGETQVLGQFRAFLSSLAPADAAWLGVIGQQLTSDARVIRDRYLRGLGSRSYGSAVRRHLEGIERVALIGGGALATELLPYLSGDRRVDQWTRDDIAAAAGRPRAGGRTAVVVAAPVDAPAVAAVAGRYDDVARVIDLRGAGDRDGLGSPAVTLEDLFADVSASSARALHRVEAARQEIRRMAAAFERRQLLRPFGWDDLCA